MKWQHAFLIGMAILGLGLAYSFLWWVDCLQCWRPTEKCPWTPVLPLLSGPVLFGVWTIRFSHKEADIKVSQDQNRMETEKNLLASDKEIDRAFKQLQEWAATRQNPILQASAIYQLHIYLHRDHSDNTYFIHPIMSILRALLDNSQQKRIKKNAIKRETLNVLEKGAIIPPEEKSDKDFLLSMSNKFRENLIDIAQNRGLGAPVLQAIEMVICNLPKEKHARNLRCWNLQDLYLRKAKLQKSNLEEANLTGAYLEGAAMNEANLIGANLSNATLYRADLQGAHLDEANLMEANLARSLLGKANIRSANLHKANLQEANLMEANLARSFLHGANLEGADLRNAILWQVHMAGVNLQWANLQDAILESGTTLSGSDLRGANLQGTYLHYVDIQGAKIEEKWREMIEKSHPIGEPNYFP